MFVLDIELTRNERALRNEPAPTFLNMPFTAAIEYAEARGLLDDEGLYDLLELYRERGVEAAEALLREIQARTERGLQAAVRDGTTLREFITGLEEQSTLLGFEARDHRYLETVFRTFVQSSYGAGRFRAMTTPAVIAARPYVEYRTVGDSRVRPAHADLDRKLWRADDPSWRRFSPPNGFNCRCSVVTLSERERGDRDVDTDVDDSLIDPRFRMAPTDIVDRPI